MYLFLAGPLISLCSITSCALKNPLKQDTSEDRVKELMVAHSDFTTAMLKLVAIVVREA